MMPTLTVFECGRLVTAERTLIDGGAAAPVTIPILAWLVQHEHGVVLFDAGLHPALVDGPSSLGRLARIFTPEIEPGATISGHLAGVGIDPNGRFDVVLSHCHFDHVGGLCELPNVRLVVHRDEWTSAMHDERSGSGGYDRSSYDLGHDVLAVDGAHDLFGDGSVTTIPTPGHTCGHQSLRVATTDGIVLLAGDACYFERTLDDGVLPPFGFDLEQQRRSLDLLRRERATGTRIMPGHEIVSMRSVD